MRTIIFLLLFAFGTALCAQSAKQLRFLESIAETLYQAAHPTNNYLGGQYQWQEYSDGQVATLSLYATDSWNGKQIGTDIGIVFQNGYISDVKVLGDEDSCGVACCFTTVSLVKSIVVAYMNDTANTSYSELAEKSKRILGKSLEALSGKELVLLWLNLAYAVS
ncbi:hypothetical protein GGR28_003052 [Lewinella aquimaris]|uniref:Uncharacterized protein n=1 Tax=Neolewinella aquimaris TaxID=1835722 RepID=A0A840EEQ3_9BACT|nr:hypothetical protein [Neolewinella aquimaris]MBB4080418.1 hypothetical protein [Neolewinella aquimaris]